MSGTPGGSHSVRLAALILLVLLASVRASAQGPTVGALKVIRQVVVTQTAAARGGPYVPAKQGQEVWSGQGVRTLRRSLAQIAFRDGSVLRMNERSDLVVQDAAALRNIRLQTGAVWLRIARGANTVVETPTATAVARGTEFIVETLPDGRTQLTVFESKVDLIASGRIVTVGAGQTTVIDRLGQPNMPRRLAPEDLPPELGGTRLGWWAPFDQENVGLALPMMTAVPLALLSGSGRLQITTIPELSGPGPAEVIIPEPGTLALLALGLLPLAAALRRRKR